MRIVHFYYGIGSRYAYLAATQIAALERDTGCRCCGITCVKAARPPEVPRARYKSPGALLCAQPIMARNLFPEMHYECSRRQ